MSSTKRGALFRIASKSLRSTFNTPSPLPNTRILRSFFSPLHNPDIVYLPWVRNDPNHLLADSVNSAIKARPRDTLWWCVITPVGISTRKTVRNWLERRVRVAWGDAMRWRGFDTEGRWLGAEAAKVDPGAAEWLCNVAKPLRNQKETNLVGTLRLSLTDQALTASIADVRRDVVMILDGLILRQANTHDTLQREKSQRSPKRESKVFPQKPSFEKTRNPPGPENVT